MLLELLDPQRFTRGVPIQGDKQLKGVMVRRLKQDLREAHIDHSFPERRVVQLALTHARGEWHVRERQWPTKLKRYEEGEARSLGSAQPFELTLARDLLRYIELVGAKGRARLSLINLHKRLLSSVNAFRLTLVEHEKTISGKRSNVLELAPSDVDDTTNADEEHGADEETLELARAAQVARGSHELPTLSREARTLLDTMLRDAARASQSPDAKTLALVDWIQTHQCPAARVRGPKSEPPRGRGRAAELDGRWKVCRLIIFTEYGDTKKYLQDVLSAAIGGSDQADERIKHLHGGMSDEAREEVRNAFNRHPSESPVRILIATDAAREGINLQAHCYNIIHFDIPWNPARLEQRNGRIDRTLQPQPEVFCRYFSHTERQADPVLATLVEKVEVIGRELGSLGAVVAEQISEDLETRGAMAGADARVEARSKPAGHRTVREELDPESPERHKVMKAEVDDADTVLHTSKQQLRFSPDQLCEVVNVGLELSGATPLRQHIAATGGEPATYTLPELPDSWQATLDTLRPARSRDQSFWTSARSHRCL